MSNWISICRNDLQRVVIVPVDDAIEHERFNKNCVCGPTLEHLGGLWTELLHHSLDGRELSEP